MYIRQNKTHHAPKKKKKERKPNHSLNFCKQIGKGKTKETNEMAKKREKRMETVEKSTTKIETKIAM